MANEATLVNAKGGPGDIVYFAVSNTNAVIPKGTLMILVDPRTATPHSGSPTTNRAIGFTDADYNVSVVSNDPYIGVRIGGIVDAVANASIVAGDLLVAGSGANRVAAASNVSATELARAFAMALEDSSEGEAINIILRFGG